MLRTIDQPLGTLDHLLRTGDHLLRTLDHLSRTTTGLLGMADRLLRRTDRLLRTAAGLLGRVDHPSNEVDQVGLSESAGFEVPGAPSTRGCFLARAAFRERRTAIVRYRPENLAATGGSRRKA